jgi:hypothetical protein
MITNLKSIVNPHIFFFARLNWEIEWYFCKYREVEIPDFFKKSGILWILNLELAEKEKQGIKIIGPGSMERSETKQS